MLSVSSLSELWIMQKKALNSGLQLLYVQNRRSRRHFSHVWSFRLMTIDKWDFWFNAYLLHFKNLRQADIITISCPSPCCWHVAPPVIRAFRVNAHPFNISHTLSRTQSWWQYQTVWKELVDEKWGNLYMSLWKLWMPTFTKFHFAGPECFPNHCWLRINSQPACRDPLLYFPRLSPRFRFQSGPEAWDRTSDHCFSTTHGLLVASAGRGSRSNQDVLVFNLTFYCTPIFYFVSTGRSFIALCAAVQ